VADAAGVEGRENRPEAVPYPICLFSYPADAVAEIIIGLRASRALRDRLSALCMGGFAMAKLLEAKSTHPNTLL